MRKPVCWLLVAVVCGSVLLASAPIHAGSPDAAYQMSWSVVASGGGIGAVGGGRILSGTIGQPAIGWSENGKNLGTGFWYGVGRGGWQPPLPVLLPIIRRD